MGVQYSTWIAKFGLPLVLTACRGSRAPSNLTYLAT
jgi:hypothetical protein